MTSSSRFWVLLALASGIGILIAWIDSQPNWDDSGISAGMVLGAAAVFGFAMPKRPWVWAITIGIWVPVIGIYQSQNYQSLLATFLALIGAYGAAAVRNRSNAQ